MLTVRMRPAVADDRAAIVELLTVTMGHGPAGDITAEFLEWKHHANPFGRSLELVAEVDGEIIGYQSFMRWRFTRDGTPVRAARAVDIVTHPAFQRAGVFSGLMRAAMPELAGKTDLVFTTPNQLSLRGNLKMGWVPNGRVPIAVRVRRPLRFVVGLADSDRRAPPGRPPLVDLPVADDVLADHDAVQTLLDEADQPHDRLRTDRDADYMRWRYTQVSSLDYRVLAMHDGADLVGLAIGRPRRRGSLAEFTLSEVIVRRGDRRSARHLLHGVARCGVDHVTTHLTGWPTVDSVRRAAGYVAMPSRGMTLVARQLNDAFPGPLTLADWALSLGDLEVF